MKQQIGCQWTACSQLGESWDNDHGMLQSLHEAIPHTGDYCTHNTHTRLMAHLSKTAWVSRYQIGKTNLDFTEARDSEWQWHQLGYMQVCTSLQTDNHASTPLLSFLQAGCLPATQPTALKHWRQNLISVNTSLHHVKSKTKQGRYCQSMMPGLEQPC